MGADAGFAVELPWEQQAARAKCFHPTGTFIPFPTEALEQSVPARFVQQVHRSPHRLAVKTRRHTLTYEALNTTANQVAQAILTLRPPGEEPVVVLLEHDAPLIAAILGTLKAGKIYVPLDPTFPQGRLAAVLAGCAGGAHGDHHPAALPGRDPGPTDTPGAEPRRHNRQYCCRRPVTAAFPRDAGRHSVHLWLDRAAQGRYPHPSQHLACGNESDQ